MEGSPPQTAESPPSPHPEDVAAELVTRDDLKGLRRWTLVAGIWAVAATAVALIALLDTSRGDAEQKAGDAGRRVGEVEQRVDRLDRDLRGLSARIDDAESRIGGLAPLSDVTKLQDRVGRAEEDASEANERRGNTRESVQDLEERVTQLEDSPPADTGGSGDSAGDDAP